MNRISTILFGSAGVLLATALTLVVAPYRQLSMLDPEPGLVPYTPSQAHGRAVYVSLGCVYCHSQQPRDRSFGPDADRGWGRAPTPADYAYDFPHQLGTMRTGPDLFNIGARQPSREWHLAHLYNPRALVPGSIMPNFPFLFDVVPAASPGDVTVNLPPGTQPAGGVVVAGEDALALVDYLLALDHTYPSAYLPGAKEMP